MLNQQLSGNQELSLAGGIANATRVVGGGGGDLPGGSVNNTLLLALNKIVYNTAAISVNTQVTASRIGRGTGEGPAGAAGTYIGKLAAGGWITGGIPGQDSVPIVAMPNEFVVRESATSALTRNYGAGIMDMINQGRLPSNVVSFPSPVMSRGSNDNASLRTVEAKLDKLIEVLAGVGAALVNAETSSGKEVANRVVAAIGGQTEEIKREARHDRNNPQQQRKAS